MHFHTPPIREYINYLGHGYNVGTMYMVENEMGVKVLPETGGKI